MTVLPILNSISVSSLSKGIDGARWVPLHLRLLDLNPWMVLTLSIGETFLPTAAGIH